jgi:hypothetical protein
LAVLEEEKDFGESMPERLMENPRVHQEYAMVIETEKLMKEKFLDFVMEEI